MSARSKLSIDPPGGPWAFETEISIEIECQDAEDIAILEWHLELEMRYYGIKAFEIHIPDQKLQVMWQFGTDSDGEPIIKLRELLISNPEIIFCPRDDEQKWIDLLPTRLEVYKNKTRIYFT